MCGETGSLQQTPRLLCTSLAASSHFWLVASPGHHMQHRWMSSTSDIYVELWEYSGKTRSPITRSLTELVSHICIPYSANAAYDDLDTYMQDDSIPKEWWPRVQKQMSPPSIQRRLQAGHEGPTPTGSPWQRTERLGNKSCHPASKRSCPQRNLRGEGVGGEGSCFQTR